MPPLLFHRKNLTAAAGNYYITIDNLGACKLRVVNAQDYTDVAVISIVIMDKNGVQGNDISIALVQKAEQLVPAKDISWQGDIDLGAYQKLIIVFENDFIGTEPTAGDMLYVTVGYELK